MGSLVKENKVEVLTKDGEIIVRLTLDINLNLNGTMVNQTQEVISSVKPKEEDDDFNIIPDFGNSLKVDGFGKN